VREGNERERRRIYRTEKEILILTFIFYIQIENIICLIKETNFIRKKTDEMYIYVSNILSEFLSCYNY